ncbi:hypothetical protein [Streptomyces sp. H27-H5]|uniref:hypothetical protein n=1 Tax=Streptomyces sp. H27-H5 TaxID=2996460 RepID=UPI002271E9CC|nr:hypothetical protein [Streptomyces sp. H27-H5]MCY0957677.1 hypothetical protein [Streptomyces sp. H27-H5]
MTAPYTTTTQAIAKGVRGDREGGLTDLQPLICESPLMMVAVLSVLAEVASLPSREHHPERHFFGLSVSDIHTGKQGSADDLPPPIRFAAQFLAAQANGDRPAAYALFDAFAERCLREENDDLGAATAALYDMAVISTLELAKHGNGGRSR